MPSAAGRPPATVSSLRPGCLFSSSLNRCGGWMTGRLLVSDVVLWPLTLLSHGSPLGLCAFFCHPLTLNFLLTRSKLLLSPRRHDFRDASWGADHPCIIHFPTCAVVNSLFQSRSASLNFTAGVILPRLWLHTSFVAPLLPVHPFVVVHSLSTQGPLSWYSVSLQSRLSSSKPFFLSR
jgi:hypothetical protein